MFRFRGVRVDLLTDDEHTLVGDLVGAGELSARLQLLDLKMALIEVRCIKVLQDHIDVPDTVLL